MITIAVQDEEIIFKVLKDDDILFCIDRDGCLKYTKDGELVDIKSEKELSLMFCLLYSQMCSAHYVEPLSREKIVQNILKNHRERTLDIIL